MCPWGGFWICDTRFRLVPQYYEEHIDSVFRVEINWTENNCVNYTITRKCTYEE
jgi:hypothetical protein